MIPKAVARRAELTRPAGTVQSAEARTEYARPSRMTGRAGGTAGPNANRACAAALAARLAATQTGARPSLSISHPATGEAMAEIRYTSPADNG